MRGHVDNPPRVRHHRQEGTDDVLEPPVIDVKRPLYLDKVFRGRLRGVVVLPRVVDQDVHLALLPIDVVPQFNHTHNVGHIHPLEVNSLRLSDVNFFPIQA